MMITHVLSVQKEPSEARSRFLSHAIAQLSGLGVRFPRIQACRPDPAAFQKELENAKDASLFLIVSDAPLGEFSVVRDGINRFAGALCERRGDYETFLRNCSGKAASLLFEANYRFPSGSVLLTDDETPAVAFLFAKNGCTFLVLPGNPEAAERIFQRRIFPLLQKSLAPCSKTLRFSCFCADSPAPCRDQILDLARALGAVADCTENDGVLTGALTVRAASTKQAEHKISLLLSKLRELLGRRLFSETGESLPEAVCRLLKEKHLKVSAAESLTGGLLSQEITSVPGASEILEIGICAYSDRIKEQAVGVPASILHSCGAVSKETAAQLAFRIRKLAAADFGVSTTGVAGPATSEGKPVGTVYTAVSRADGIFVRKCALSESMDREEIRRRTVHEALFLLWHCLKDYPLPLPGGCPVDRVTLIEDADLFKFPVAAPKQPPVSGIGEPPVFKETTAFQADQTPASLSETESAESDKAGQAPPSSPSSLLPDGSSGQSVDTVPQTVSPPRPKDSSESEVNEPKPAEEIRKSGEETAFSSFESEPELPVEPMPSPALKKAAGASPKAPKKHRRFSIAGIAAGVLAIAMVLAAVFSVRYFSLSAKEDRQLAAARETFYSSLYPQAAEALQRQNADFCAWLYIPDSDIDHPVYQGADNTYYTSHNAVKKESRYGALFLDSRCEPLSDNTILYGNSMKDGRMFGSLSLYLDRTKALNHRSITLTDETGIHHYLVFAVMVTNTEKADDDGNAFNFLKPKLESEAAFQSYLEELTERSIYRCSSLPSYGTPLLTLVTPNDAFASAKTVVVAMQYDEGSAVESSSLTVNPTPRYPAAWYKNRGETPPSAADS